MLNFFTILFVGLFFSVFLLEAYKRTFGRYFANKKLNAYSEALEGFYPPTDLKDEL